MLLRAVEKSCPDERAGVLVDYRGNLVVMEFSEMRYETICERDDLGRLVYKYGFTFGMVIDVNVVLHYCNSCQFDNQFHITQKCIPYYDDILGRTKKPIRPNGRKLERYVYDIFRHIYTITPVSYQGNTIPRSRSMPCRGAKPTLAESNPNHLRVEAIITDRCNWAPVRNNRESTVATAATACETLLENSRRLVESHGGVLLAAKDVEKDASGVCGKDVNTAYGVTNTNTAHGVTNANTLYGLKDTDKIICEVREGRSREE